MRISLCFFCFSCFCLCRLTSCLLSFFLPPSGEFLLQPRHGLSFWVRFDRRGSVPPPSGRPLPHHPPPHQGVQVGAGQRSKRWVLVSHGRFFYRFSIQATRVCAPLQMFPPLRCPSTTATAPPLPAAPSGVSSGTTPRRRQRPSVSAPCRRRPKG